MQEEEPVCARLAVDAARLGLPPPPVHVALAIVREGECWSVMIRSASEHPLAELAAWLESAGARIVEIGPDGLLQATFFASASRWQTTLGCALRAFLVIDPDGRAVLDVEGARAEVSALIRRLRAVGIPPLIRRVATARDAPPLLTGPQDAALRAAFSAGYYDIPRPLNLHDLAHTLGVSSASLSERLRRAEGRLVRRYVAGGLEIVLFGKEGDATAGELRDRAATGAPLGSLPPRGLTPSDP